MHHNRSTGQRPHEPALASTSMGTAPRNMRRAWRSSMPRLSAIPALLLISLLNGLLLGNTHAADRTDPPSVAQVAAKIDGFLESHWSTHNLRPAEPADDAIFLRRLSLDLTGRIPTTAELDRFLKDKSKDKRAKIIRQMLDGPEFPLHWGSVLDGMIQTRYAGNTDFVDWMRRSVRDGKSWDTIFRELMLGPWDTDQQRPANRFLDKRARTTDVLTVDATRVFFGVDISCARCHDHPLVADWSQSHFYGMVSFFNRTTGGKGKVGEKAEGDVKFVAGDGNERTAQVMFLSGQILSEDTASSTSDASANDRKTVSRRELLVDVALSERRFFSRSLVNRMWAYHFGRGLVEPVDQMHSANPPAVPGLLEWLAEDFAASGYDLKRLIAALVSTRAYQLDSRWPHDSEVPGDDLFAVQTLRPLSRRQLAISLLLATGNAELAEPDSTQRRLENYIGVPGVQRIESYLEIERQAAELTAALDDRSTDFRSSALEALFLSNNPAALKLVAPTADNLAARLQPTSDSRELVRTAVRTILSREPGAGELQRLTEWFEARAEDRPAAIGQLIWALATSAEFRFNH